MPALAPGVLDHHRLADPLLQPLADDPRQRVRQSARRIRHDDPDRLARVLLRCRRNGRERGEQKRGNWCGAQQNEIHCETSLRGNFTKIALKADPIRYCQSVYRPPPR
jgi:hypothetical protein